MSHSIYSPSASDRNLACTQSIVLTRKLGISGGEHNFYTASGTVLHQLGENTLRMALIDNEDPEDMLANAVGQPWSWLVDDLPEEFAKELIDEEGADQARTYLRCVRELIGDQKVARIYLEHRVAMDDIMFGTVDLIIVTTDGCLYIVDLKTGSGKQVIAWNNPQLKTYAAMFIHGRRMPPMQINNVVLVIIQPPFDTPMTQYSAGLEEIDSHHSALNNMRYQVEHDLAAYATGSHCRWCPARAMCPEIGRVATSAQNVVVDGLTAEGWGEVLKMAELLEPWCKAIKERVHQVAVVEKAEIPGYKVVRKLGRTTWTSKTAAALTIAEELEAAGDTDTRITNDPTLRTPAQLRKELKGLIDTGLIDTLITTPDRGFLVVPESDKREAVKLTPNYASLAKICSVVGQ